MLSKEPPSTANRASRRTVIVHRKRVEAHHVASFELRSVDGAPLPSFSAGSHIDVHVPGGAIRQYSLAGDPAERDHYRIAVLREVASRGGSSAMHDIVSEGDLIQISEPRNNFPLLDAECSVLIAGGIGVTPLLSMAYALRARGSNFTFFYCARSEERAAFRDELSATFPGRCRFYFDEGAHATKLDVQRALAETSRDTQVYVCGPTGFIDYVRFGAIDAGLTREQVNSESFQTVGKQSQGASFVVRLASSGTAVQVEPNQTVVDALSAAGIIVPTSCGQGLCGSCLTTVLEGECDHRDTFLTDEEKARHDQFTPCCSRARGACLLLDL